MTTVQVHVQRSINKIYCSSSHINIKERKARKAKRLAMKICMLTINSSCYDTLLNMTYSMYIRANFHKTYNLTDLENF